VRSSIFSDINQPLEKHMEQISISTRDAAQVLGIGRSSVYILIQSGALDAFKIGRRTLVTTESIRRLVKCQSVIVIDWHMVSPPS